MSRCPSCFRRLGAHQPCPKDGSPPRESSTVSPTLQAPQVNGYEIAKLLGVGGMGSVWDATRLGDHQQVALKLCHLTDAKGVDRFLLEAQLLSQIGAPHVPEVYEQGVLPDGHRFFAMQKLGGQNLASELETLTAPPDVETIAGTARALFSSLQAIHSRGIVHCDLKPENIFLFGTGSARAASIIDFGIARTATQAPEEVGAGGTAEYIAPEQLRSGAPVDCRADIYCLGLILYELFTLRLPFSGETKELEYGHLNLRPPPPSTFAPVGRAFDDLILRCLAKEPERRFHDVAQVQKAFEHALRAGSQRRVEAATQTKSTAKVDKQRVVLAFLEVKTTSAHLTAVLSTLGGFLAHAAGGQAVVAFTHQDGEHPARRAQWVSHALIERGFAQRAHITLAQVVVKPKPDGSLRFLSPLFTQPSQYPQPSDPPGVLLHSTVRELLPEFEVTAVDGRPDTWLVQGEVGYRTTAFSTTVRHRLTPLVGRDAVINRLAADVRKMVSKGQTRVTTVIGDVGLGKTRLAAELSQTLRTEFPLVKSYELQARDASAPNEMLAHLLRTTLDLPSTAPPDGGRAVLTERLGPQGAALAPGVAAALGWLSDTELAAMTSKAAPGVLRASASRAVAEGLRLAGQKHPTVLMLDDAHWADSAVLEALERVAVEEVPLSIIIFAKPVFETLQPTWGRRALHHQQLTLEPLPPEAASDLCRALLQPVKSVPQAVVDRLVERTRGVPSLLVDLISGLRKDGLIQRPEQGGSWYVASEVLDRLPDLPLVEWLSHREVTSLSPGLLAHARLAATLAPEFSAEEFEGVLNELDAATAAQFPLDARVGSDRLAHMGILSRRDSGRYAFRSPLLRDVLTQGVDPALRSHIHRAAQTYYRGAQGLPEFMRLRRLARHAAEVGDREEAAQAFLAVADTARARHHYLEAELLYSQSLAQWSDEPALAPMRLRVLHGRAVMRYRLGRYDDSLHDFEAGVKLARQLADPAAQAELLLDESMALDWLEEWRQSKLLAEEASAIPGIASSPLLHARLQLALGRSAIRFNDNQRAIDLLRQAAAEASALGDTGYEVVVIANMLLGFILPFVGLGQEAQTRLDAVQLLCEAQGDELHLAAILSNRSCVWIMLNDPERFAKDVEAVLALARRMGNLHLERTTHFNAGIFYYWRGEYARAEKYTRSTIAMDEQRFRHGYRPEATVLLIRILWCQDRIEAAHALLTSVRQHQVAAVANKHSEQVLAPNDALLFDVMAQIIEETGASATQWDPLLQRAREVAQGQELIEILELRGLAAARAGDVTAARQAWQEAIDLSASIPNVMEGRVRERLLQLP